MIALQMATTFAAISKASLVFGGSRMAQQSLGTRERAYRSAFEYLATDKEAQSSNSPLARILDLDQGEAQ